MGYTYRQELTKFDYSICLAAALCYLMIHQQDPVGLLTFDEKIRHSLRPKTRRSHLGDVLSLLANLKPEGETDIAHSLMQVAAMLRHASLVMIFSDLLADPEPVLESLYRLRHGGHDVILFHILDEAEVHFPFDGMVELEEPENHDRLALDADGFRSDYIAEIDAFRDHGGVAVVVTTRERAEAWGATPLFSLVGMVSTGVDPARMGEGPGVAIKMVLEKTGLTLGDMDLIEVNEAFAVQCLANERQLGWDRSRVNVFGGAVALGHPTGVSGARIVGTLDNALRTLDKELGVAAICGGGGVTTAMIIKRES